MLSRHQKLSKLVLLPLLVLSATVDAKQSSQEQTKAEIKLSSSMAYDSNPFRFSKRLKPSGSEYIETKIRASYDLNQSFSFEAKLDDKRYGSDTDEANSIKYTLGTAFVNRFKFLDRKSRFRSKLRWGQFDKTYVSRSTGEIAQWSNEEIGDRYDYSYWESKNDLSWKYNKQTRLIMNLDHYDKNYQDFSDATISDLDYSETSLGFTWGHKFNKQHKLKAKIEHTLRSYDDYRAHDKGGVDVAGSDLEYRTWMARLTYSAKLGNSWRLSAISQIAERKDNAVGYDDSTKTIVRLGVDYHVSPVSVLKVSVMHTKNDYSSRAAEQNVVDDDQHEETGFRYRFQYERELQSVKGLSVISAYRYDDKKSGKADYQHNRSQVSLGLEYKL